MSSCIQQIPSSISMGCYLTQLFAISSLLRAGVPWASAQSDPVQSIARAQPEAIRRHLTSGPAQFVPLHVSFF
jgi:hypothetical protein